MEETTTQDETSKPGSVYDFIAGMVDAMAAIAWQKLGLHRDMMTGNIEKDLAEAKVAIDLTAHLATFIYPRLDAEDKRVLENLVKDLRLNYVQQNK
ncbi:MAG: DUF1844 domain-containing protein [Fimbriimonadaceae bacterium]